MAYDATKDEFLEWMLLDKRTRERNGLPTSQAQFADWKGINDRTLTRWKKDPEFQARLEQRKLEEAQRLTPNATVSDRFTDGRARRHDRGLPSAPDPGEGVERDVRPSGVGEDEWTYERVKAVIAERAMEGNKDALDLWLKHWGKPFVDAEHSEDEGLSGLSNEELVGKIIDLVGTELVSRVLVHRQVGAE